MQWLTSTRAMTKDWPIKFPTNYTNYRETVIQRKHTQQCNCSGKETLKYKNKQQKNHLHEGSRSVAQAQWSICRSVVDINLKKSNLFAKWMEKISYINFESVKYFQNIFNSPAYFQNFFNLKKKIVLLNIFTSFLTHQPIFRIFLFKKIVLLSFMKKYPKTIKY